MNHIGLYRYAVATSLFVLAVVAIGSSVTTQRAALAVPGWPLAFGQALPRGPLAAGAVLALVHQYVAAFAALLVFGLNIAVVRSVKQPRLTSIAGTASAVILCQAVLGGTDILLGGPSWIGLFHAVLAQIELVLVASVAFFLSEAGTASFEPVHDYGWPSLRSLAVASPVFVLLQIMLGAFYRHHIFGLIPHVVAAMLVSGAVLLFGLFTLTQFPQHNGLRKLAIAVLLALCAQVVLGVVTYMSGMSADDQTVPAAWAIVATAGHVACGGVLFVFCSLLGIQVRRCVLPKLAPATEVQAAS